MSEASTTEGKKSGEPSGIMLKLPGSLGVGLQGGTVALLLFIGDKARDAFDEMLRQQEATRAAMDAKVETLNGRMMTLEGSVKDLGNDKAKVADLAAQMLELQEQLNELEDTVACMRDRKKCRP